MIARSPFLAFAHCFLWLALCPDPAHTADDPLFTTARTGPVHTQHIGNDQDHAAVAMMQDGSYLVAWHSAAPNAPPVDRSVRRRDTLAEARAIQYRLFHPDGTPMTDERTLRIAGFPIQNLPAVATDGHTCFAIAWNVASPRLGHTAWVQVIDRQGNPFSLPQRINPFPSLAETFPDIAMHPWGWMVIAWSHFTPTHQDHYATARHWSGLSLWESRKLNSSPLNSPSAYGLPVIRLNDAGQTVVAWAHAERSGRSAILATTFPLAFGPPLLPSPERIIGPTTEPDSRSQRPSLTIDQSGRTVVAFTRRTRDAPHTVLAQSFYPGLRAASPLFPFIEDPTHAFERPVVQLFDDDTLLAFFTQIDTVNEKHHIVGVGYEFPARPAIDPFALTPDYRTYPGQTRPALATSSTTAPERFVVTWEAWVDRPDTRDLDIFYTLFE